MKVLGVYAASWGIWALPLIEAAVLYAHTAQALGARAGIASITNAGTRVTKNIFIISFWTRVRIPPVQLNISLAMLSVTKLESIHLTKTSVHSFSIF